MLALDKVGIQFGGRKLFDGLSFTVRPGERVSLAGPNGAGKSTLLKVITGNETPDSGRVVAAKWVDVGYLPQEGIEVKGKTLYAEAETAFSQALEIQRSIEEVGERMSELDPTTEEYRDLVELYGELQLRLEHHDVSRMRPRIETTLAGLGFSKADLERQTEEFSGGWQMRIALAKLLLREPEVLLLDEPTNHLDIESQTWLESYLRNYPGAILLVSHDRAFLDSLTNRTLAFEHGTVTLYAGNYSFFVKESAARREQLHKAYRNQQREIQKTQEFIDRFRSKATKASQVQSRIKQLEKMDLIEIEEEDDGIAFDFPQPKPSGHMVMRIDNVTKAYGDGPPVFERFNLNIERRDRIAVVGPNGAGKSTFSRLVSGVEPATSGTVELGHNVTVSHFAQDHAKELDPNRTVLQTIEDIAPRGVGNLRTLLGCFLFKGDDVFKRVSVLSGGERSRLALARMLLLPANFLVLDEPTNHLDMRSQDMLRRALDAYEGTYCIVSHNRDFLDPIVTKVLEFQPGQPPKVHLGNVSDFLEKKRAEEMADAMSGKAGNGSGASRESSGKGRKEQRREEARKREERNRKIRPLEENLEAVEAEIEGLEQRKRELVEIMGAPDFADDAEKVQAISAEYREADTALQKAYSDWDSVSDALEAAQKEFGSV